MAGQDASSLGGKKGKAEDNTLMLRDLIMNIKQSVKNHPRRVGGCCLALMGVTLIIVIITITSSEGNTKSCVI